jgi:hypothetical protein
MLKWRKFACAVIALGLVSSAQAASAAPARKSTVAAPGEERADTVAARQVNPYRTDTMEIVIPAGRGLEVKTHLAKGAALVYFWKTTKGEAVLHDFHGEPVDAEEDEFESFIEDKAASESRGVLIAPFTGLHGWYWKNTSSTPVTLVLQASGFYKDVVRK